MTKAMTHRNIFNMYGGFVENYITSFEKLFKNGIDTGEFKTMIQGAVLFP
jgi:hypothetical protein